MDIAANFETSGNAVPGLSALFEAPLTQALFEDNLSLASKSDGVGSTVGLELTETQNLSESLRMEQQEKEGRQDLDDDLFNGFNSNSLGLNSSNTESGIGTSGVDAQSSEGQLNTGDNTKTDDSEDSITGISSDQPLIPLATNDSTSDSSLVEQENLGTQLGSVESEQVSPLEIASDENAEPASDLASVETLPLSITEGLGNGEGFTIDLPEFPTAVVEAQLEETNNLASLSSQPNPTPPIFQLEGISVEDASMTLILDQDFLVDPNNPENQNFYFELSGGPLGDREATIETGAATMDLVRFFPGNESQAMNPRRTGCCLLGKQMMSPFTAISSLALLIGAM